MARRIVVIISQSPLNQPERRELEEELATKLLFERGIDVSLVPHLEHLEPGSTGLLCLEGIKGDLVLLSWMRPDEAHATLQNRGIAGRRGQTALAGPVQQLAGEGDQQFRKGAGPQAQRFIYHLALDDGHSPETLLQEIHRLRQEKSVETVPLSLAGALGEKPQPSQPSRPSPPEMERPIAPDSNGETPAAGSSRRTPPISPGPTHQDPSLDTDEALDLHLDKLLNEFDRTDW